MPSCLYLRAVLVVSVMTVGCASLAPAELIQRPAASVIEAYGWVGRVSVRQGETNHSANIAWQHDASRDEILLSTPLGQGIAELTRDAKGARLMTADRREFAAADLEALSVRLFGLVLPLTSLPRWLIGDAPVAVSRDTAGRPKQFSEGGWTVVYRDYESEAASALPVQIELRRGEIEVRLRIDDWEQVK